MAFANCSKIVSVTLGSSLEKNGDGAFEFCTKIIEAFNSASIVIRKGSYDNGWLGVYADDIHSGVSRIVNIDGFLFYKLNNANYLVGYI